MLLSKSPAADEGPLSLSHATHKETPVRLLLVAAINGLPYRVLRCARECATEIYVMGNLGAREIGLSRHCEKFVPSRAIINGSYDEALALEINCLARELDIAMVLPGDAPATRALIACRHLLEVPSFPLPDLERFDLLNDKWRFGQLCDEINIRCPMTRLFPDVATLEMEIEAGRVEYPVMVKPLTLAGGQGQFVLNQANIATQLKRVNYRPLLTQQLIQGRDLVVSVYCQEGKVTAFIGHELKRRIYSTFWNESVFHDIQRIAARVGAEGVYNFDLIATDDGDFYFLECNPRFFFTMDWAMLAGINFVALGLRGNHGPDPIIVPAGLRLHAPEASLLYFRSWPHLTRRDWSAARLALADPIYYLLQQFGMLV